MEQFVVSARKYRPQTFRDVVGQQAITNTLLNAIENNHLAQALLFCGPRGVGKTTCARILAKKINQDGQESPEEDFAFNIFELDAASNNSVDDIRNLIDQVRIPPQSGKYKVYIIDEVHMLSQAAFNAFLKTLEEPPKHAIFILATTEKHKIIPTILSRCQIFDFKRITVKDAAEYLKYIAENQGIEADDDALHIIAQKADGAMRDALSIFDRVVSFSGQKLTRQAVTENLNVLDYDTYFKATDLILENNIPQLLIDFNETLARGFDGHHFIAGLASHFRDLLVCKNEATIPLLEVGSDAKQRYLEQSRKASVPFLMKGIELANTCDLNYKTSKNQRLLTELCLMQLASITFDGEKKNDTPFIIPPAFFRDKRATEHKDKTSSSTISQAAEPVSTYETTPVTASKPHTDTPAKKTETTPPAVEEKRQPTSPIEIGKKRVSGLSLSSIKAKKELEKNKKETRIDESSLPREPFTEEDMQKAWDSYVKQMNDKGKKIIASNLATDRPKLKNSNTIWIELPNDTMKKEVEREQFPLMEYLKDQLHNHFISLQVTVNETIERKYAFTPQEKYAKLRETNPMIDMLRSEFDLDI
ncbi:DNA polymerase III subunit gamma/tau [Sinomicrobium weinanense]|uniref:DNA polymerase III subunit gamma/tau n=1 Tax=Sinomicrobium weinanense TaxID=2842200 RepID=A0A926JPY8_9FLAO|nr:DNA polymerase III subunit gamma/tau [Sinomicrobium weinanense]MBC9795315.1 DNA polymerase III subunit gamma/tau [Sinomicrobium weinanense]MBU3122970.1 DNA polymerase III subunit gamma/tau [Sinomicrobium weinanense]